MKSSFCLAAVLAAAFAATASAQTVSFATLREGSPNHTTAAAVAKILKEQGGIDMRVQPTAGDAEIFAMVNRGEAAVGITNAFELAEAVKNNSLPEVRILGAPHTLRMAFFVRKDSPMKTIADLKGKKVLSYSAMKAVEQMSDAILATAGLTEKDLTPVVVPNVVRGADDFVSGAADMFFFAFGNPKVAEVDAKVGGIRALEIDAAGMPAAREIRPYSHLTQVGPGPTFIGVTKPMNVYSFDNLFITSTKVPDELVYKIIDTLLKNKDALAKEQPVLGELSAQDMYKQYDVPYHPAAVKYFKEHNVQPAPIR